MRHYLITGRTRRFLGAAATGAALLGAAACSTGDILEVTDPDIINPGDVQTAAGARALRVGALGRFNDATTGATSSNTDDGLFRLGGLLADEWRSSDTFSQRDETDTRSVQESNTTLTTAVRDAHRARVSAQQAIVALREFEQPAWMIAQMYLVQAYVENLLGEHMCSGIPFSTVVGGQEEFGAPLTTAQTFERALAHVDTALIELGSDAGADAAVLRDAAAVLQGRILLNLGDFAGAGDAVVGVTVDSSWFNEHSVTTNENANWKFNTEIGRYSVGTGEGTNGLDFSADPRIPTCISDDRPEWNIMTCPEDGDVQVTRPFDTSFDEPLVVQLKFPDREAPQALTSEIEARLIEAEAALAANQYATAVTGTLAILNDLRAAAGLTALASTDVPSERVDQLFDERAFWLWGTGHRLGDLRRLIRQYSRTEDQVFPNVAGFGDDVNFPIPQAEENNPNFEQCIDRNA